MIHVFDSGAGGAYVSELLTAHGVHNKLSMFPNMFPFGNKTADQLLSLFHDYRNSVTGTVFCACNTMSLVLNSNGYDFTSCDVIPTFPNLSPDAPVCYGTKNTVCLAQILSPNLRVRAVPNLVSMAEDVYQGRADRKTALALWEQEVRETIQLGSTHLSWLAHTLGVAGDHVEPDYMRLYVEHLSDETIGI